MRKSNKFLAMTASRASLAALLVAAAAMPGLAHANAADGSTSTAETGAETDSESGAGSDTRSDKTIIVSGYREGDYSVADQETALRMPLTIKETPQSITVVTRAQIDDFRLDTVNDLLRQTNGVNVDSFDSERTYYVSRGFDISNFQYDGIGMPMDEGLQIGSLDTSTYDRVEVVRGSTGLLSLTGNPSAVVNFVRKRATTETGGTASLSYGSYDEVRGNVDLNTALTDSGSIRARFVGNYDTANSYRDYYKTSRMTLYGTVSADLGPDTVLTAGYSWYESNPKGVTWGGLPTVYSDGSAASYPRSATTAQPWTSWDSIDRSLFGDITHDFGNSWTGKVSVQRRVRNQDAKLFYVYGDLDKDTGEGLYSYPGAYLDTFKETVVDAHIGGKLKLLGGEHDVLLGATYGQSSYLESEAEADVAYQPLSYDEVFHGGVTEPTFGDYTVQGDFSTKIQSAYGMVRLSLLEPLKVILGSSVVHAHRTGTSYGAPYHFDATRALPYLGATFDITGHLTAYASYATIFNPQIKFGEGADGTPTLLKPLEGDTYEVGLKSQWFEGKLNASVSVFRTHESNYAPTSTFDVASGLYLYDPVDALSRGVEVDVMGEVLPGLQVSGGYTYTDIQDENGDPALLYEPRHTAKLAVTYVPPMLQALKLGASARYQSSTSSNVVQGDYAILDLMARYQLLRNASLSVNVNNLTNVKYWESLRSDQALYGAPRTWMVTLGVNF